MNLTVDKASLALAEVLEIFIQKARNAEITAQRLQDENTRLKVELENLRKEKESHQKEVQ